MAEGETVICTFTNTKRGSITIIMDAVPDNPQDFSFTSTSSTDTAIGSFSLDDDGDESDDPSNNLLPSRRTFADRKPGSLELLATGTENFLGGDPPNGDPAVGFPPGFAYVGLPSAVINEQNEIMLGGRVSAGNFFVQPNGVWVDRGAGLDFVAGEKINWTFLTEMAVAQSPAD